MITINLSEELVDKLNIVEGKDIGEKIFTLLEANVLLRLKECEEWMFKFESKYGMDFKGFEKAWGEGRIKNRHSHSVERDFMEWEGFDSERKKWLETLSEIKAAEI